MICHNVSRISPQTCLGLEGYGPNGINESYHLSADFFIFGFGEPMRKVQ